MRAFKLQFNRNLSFSSYENTVRGQFFGHTHTDELRVHYLNADPTQRATAVSYVNPSITTYSGRNPGFRIYTIDGYYNGSSYASTLFVDTYTLTIFAASTRHGDMVHEPDRSERQWRYEQPAVAL